MSLPAGTVMLTGHTDTPWRVVPLPDGELIATSSWDLTVRVFAVASGALQRTLAGHGSPVWALAALGGDVVASGDMGGGMRLWKARTGECTFQDDLGANVAAIAALGGGRFVASAGCGLHLFEHRDGHGVTPVRQVPFAHSSAIDDIAVCGGRFTTASRDKTAAVWAAPALEQLAVLDGHAGTVHRVAMDERWIVTGAWDETVRVHDARTFQCARVLEKEHSDWVMAVVIVGGDSVLSAASDGTLCVFDLRTGALVTRVQLPFDIFSVAVTQDGRLAVAGSGGNIAVLPAPAEAAQRILRHSLALRAAARPGPVLRALFAIETGADPWVLRRALACRRSQLPQPSHTVALGGQAAPACRPSSSPYR
jgi:WD40 repeat protein